MPPVQNNKVIAILIGQMISGGAEKQSILLASELVQKYTVYYIAFKPGKIDADYKQKLDREGIPVISLRGGFLPRLLQLFHQFRRLKVRILFCYLPGDNVIGTIVGRMAGVKYIIGGIRNTKIVKKKFYLLRFIQNRYQDKIIFNSSVARDEFCSRGYQSSKCFVIENGIQIHNAFKVRKEQIPVQILMVGRFVHQKDYLTGLNAFSHLLYLEPTLLVRIIITGYGVLEATLRSWIAQKNLEEIIEVHVNPPHLFKLYKQCDIYFNSSRFEGMSNAIMEAMVSGLPVVATNTGDIHKLVLQGENGYISEVGDYQELANSLLKLCTDYNSRINYGKAGYKRICSNFSSTSFGSKYESLINALN